MNVIIVHGCPGSKERTISPDRTYDRGWLAWLVEKLTAQGIPAKIAYMPEPWKPDYEGYKEAFPEDEVDEGTVLIGTSCGTSFLMRWLGDTKRRAKKLILVAPWKTPESGRPQFDTFYTFDIDPGINERVEEIIAFTAPDEREDGKRSLAIIQETLDLKVISLEGHGHYTVRDMGHDDLPELLEAVLS